MTSLIWLTAEEAAKNRGKVLSLYRQLLRSINSPKLQLSYASRLAKKAEVKTIFLFGSEEISKLKPSKLSLSISMATISIFDSGSLRF
ncbi:hypothetical protein V5N11_005589 [Cardamine amara subsp. amara]|uniref:LYR motif containing domain-containing protein n=1 Tax=Cardamine amara subsp. amara TaxID=228776 RepID=A0ABD1B4S8_CARAN